MPKARRINHINLRVNDLERSRHFYQNVFCLELRYRGEREAVLTTPDTSDVLALYLCDATHPAGPGGLEHFGFELETGFELDLAVREVEGAGGKLVERSDRGPGGGPVAYVADPDGYVIQIDVNPLGPAWRKRPIVPS